MTSPNPPAATSLPPYEVGRLGRAVLDAVSTVVVGKRDALELVLAGILAALDWTAANRPDAKWVLSAAGDCPFLPRDLVARLEQARAAENAELAVASSGGQTHPVIGLWPVGLRGDLRTALVDEDLRKIEAWTGRHGVAIADWPAVPFDPFFNVNRPDDLAEAYALFAEMRMDHQVERLRAGSEPDDLLDPHELNALERRYLREAFREVSKLLR